MRIHFVVRSLREDGAGSHQNAISYIRYLKERGHTVTVHAITSFNNPPTDITLTAHNQEKLGLIAGNRFLSKLLLANQNDADIFFLYGVDCIWGGGAYRKNGGSVPVAVYLDTHLATMNGGRPPSTIYYAKRLVWEKLFGMRLAAFVDSYIAVSPFIKDKYVHAGFPEKRFEIITNFFEFIEITPKKIQASPVVQLLYAGRLTHDKGIDMLIHAVKDIPPQLSWHLCIVGEGPLKEECEIMIRKYNLETRVEIVPWINQGKLKEVYESADIFIHPSRCPEAFGRTFVEAMSHGIPIIASNIGAAPETIGKAGIFFSSENIAELRETITRLACDAALRKQLGDEGVRQSRTFTKEIVGPHLECVLEGIRKRFISPR